MSGTIHGVHWIDDWQLIDLKYESIDLAPTGVTPGGVVFVGATGHLTTDYNPVANTGLWYDPVLARLHSEGSVYAYVPVPGDLAVTTRFGTLGTGDPNDDSHGVAYGLHWTGTAGDVPGASYVASLCYFNGQLNFGTSGSYKVQIGPLRADGSVTLTPWDPQNGTNASDNISDLGRWTDAAVSGYTRHLRWRRAVLGDGVYFGGDLTASTTPAMTQGATSTHMAFKLGDGSAFTTIDIAGILNPSATVNLLFSSAKAAADTGVDFVFNTNNTRAGGKLFEIYNNSSIRLSLADGAGLTIPVGGVFVGNLDIQGDRIADNAVNASLGYFGNKNAADVGADVLIGGSVARSAGKIASFLNGVGALGTEEAYVDFAGRFGWISGNTQSTVGAAGGASPLPGPPLGYAKINVAGSVAVVPYYNP